MTEIDPWMEILLDGTILSRSQNIIDYDTPQKYGSNSVKSILVLYEPILRALFAV